VSSSSSTFPDFDHLFYDNVEVEIGGKMELSQTEKLAQNPGAAMSGEHLKNLA
jgi:hypothetical protein